MAKLNLTLSSRVDRGTLKSEVKIRFIATHSVTLRGWSGLFVPPDRWNKKTGSIRISTLKTPEQEELLKVADQLSRLTALIYDRFGRTSNDKVNKEWLEQLILEFHKMEGNNAPKPQKENTQTKVIGTPEAEFSEPKIETESIPSFNKYFADFVKSAPKRRNKKTGRLIVKSTVRSYQTTYNHIIAFTAIQEKEFYTFEEIDTDFYNAYIDYLESKEFTANTVGKLIKTLKAVLRQAETDKINKNPAFHDFIAFSESVDNVYLSETELEMIRTTNLQISPIKIMKLIAAQDVDFKMLDDDWLVYGNTLERVRDWFFLLAWTASRFSDLEKITQQEVNSGFITFRQQKTNEKVIIPIHPVIREIFVRNNYKMPPPISIQKFNNYIKVICLLAGLTNIESRTRTEGGVLRTKTFPKWMLISSHTGRRSFCTNMYLRGFPMLTIMAISGHTTEKSFLEYIKVNKQQHAQFMLQLWSKFYQPIEANPNPSNVPIPPAPQPILMPFPNQMNIFSDIQNVV